jgi:small-conductance mechanosensitive channel
MAWPKVLTWGERGFTTPLFQLAGTSITLNSLLTFAAIVIISYGASRLAQRALGRILGTMTLQKAGTSVALKRLVHYVVLLLGVGIALQTVGIRTQALLTAGAVFVVAIGFALQNTVQNFVSGFILLFEHMIQPGDILEVEGNLVKITEMGIRTTIARTQNEEDIIIPNSILAHRAVKSYTMNDSLFRLEARVRVSYRSDMKQVLEVLRGVARDLPWRRPEKDPAVQMDEFGDSGVHFRVLVWVDDPWVAPASDLNEKIWWALKEAGIMVAYPQRDVHLGPEVVEALSRESTSRPALVEHPVPDPCAGPAPLSRQ